MSAPDRLTVSPRVNRWGLALLAVVLAGFSVSIRGRVSELERRLEVLSWRVEGMDRAQGSGRTGALTASEREALSIFCRGEGR